LGKSERLRIGESPSDLSTALDKFVQPSISMEGVSLLGIDPATKQLYGATRAKDLDTALNKRWTIEFQIADFPRPDGTNNIPFFSKLTLRDEARDIEAMEFKVSVRFIKLTRITQAST
jgi:hypothetical protein